jgi:hypothetical protein
LVGKEGGSEIAEESGKDGGFDQNAGGGVATLPCGEAGGFGDRASGAEEVGIAKDDSGIFSAEFEGDVFGGIEGSEFREKRAARSKGPGKDNGANAGIESESAGEMGAALSHLKNSWRKDGGDELGVAGTNVWSKRGGFQNHGISSEKMSGGRTVAEVEGEIKRADDEGGTAWAQANATGLGTIVGAFLGEKAFGVTNGKIDFGDEGSRFGAGFDNRLTNFATDALG